jgi:hypothetical protein
MGEIVQLKFPARPRPRKRPAGVSQYEIYMLPFFDVKTRRVWAPESTGRYSYDCAVGETFAIKFLQSCDGSLGWSTLMSQITLDMILAGPSKDTGLIIGFMGTIGKFLAQHANRDGN